MNKFHKGTVGSTMLLYIYAQKLKKPEYFLKKALEYSWEMYYNYVITNY